MATGATLSKAKGSQGPDVSEWQGLLTHHYKVYATPAEGAAHLIKHMTLLRPTSWASDWGTYVRITARGEDYGPVTWQGEGWPPNVLASLGCG